MKTFKEMLLDEGLFGKNPGKTAQKSTAQIVKDVKKGNISSADELEIALKNAMKEVKKDLYTMDTKKMVKLRTPIWQAYLNPGTIEDFGSFISREDMKKLLMSIWTSDGDVIKRLT